MFRCCQSQCTANDSSAQLNIGFLLMSWILLNNIEHEQHFAAEQCGLLQAVRRKLQQDFWLATVTVLRMHLSNFWRRLLISSSEFLLGMLVIVPLKVWHWTCRVLLQLTITSYTHSTLPHILTNRLCRCRSAGSVMERQSTSGDLWGHGGTGVRCKEKISMRELITLILNALVNLPTS